MYTSIVARVEYLVHMEFSVGCIFFFFLKTKVTVRRGYPFPLLGFEPLAQVIVYLTEKK